MSARDHSASRESLELLRVEPGGPVSPGDLPSVAIVVLNYNGRHHLDGCFESLAALDYPKDRLEVILVDNASSDGSLEEMRVKHPWVRVHVNDHNSGFSAGCNQGADMAQQAEIVVFLNNDMRVEPSWLAELVAPIVRGECAATTAKMYSWDGKLINSCGGGMNFHGIGIQHGYLEEPGPEHEVPRLTLFACGGAMAIDRSVFFEVGGFDQEFFAYYEDMDLGWRMWVQGYEVRYVPEAVCYHHHSSTSGAFPLETVRLLQVRNPAFACFKNYDEDNLKRVLPALLGLAMRRMLLVSGVSDDRPFRIQQASTATPGLLERLLERFRGGRTRRGAGADIGVSRVALADLIGLNDLLGNWGHWTERRREVQSRRKRADEEIFRLFLKPMWCIEEEPGYKELHEGLSDLTGVTRLFEDPTDQP